MLAVRQDGLSHIPVCLQCERNVACSMRGPSESRQAGARARGGARNLQVTLSGLIVDSVSHVVQQVFVHFQLELDQQELDRLDPTRGLTRAVTRAGLLRRRVCVCVTVCARARVCVCVCACVRARACVCVCMNVCIYLSMHVHLCVHRCLCTTLAPTLTHLIVWDVSEARQGLLGGLGFLFVLL